jgi:hypothetical protein
MAAIHYDQLKATPFADANIKGYPSVIIVGKKKMAEFGFRTCLLIGI